MEVFMDASGVNPNETLSLPAIPQEEKVGKTSLQPQLDIAHQVFTELAETSSVQSLELHSIQCTSSSTFNKVDAPTFHKAIKAAKEFGYTKDEEKKADSKWFQAYVHLYSESEYGKDGVELFLLEDESIGFALKTADDKKGKEIVSVFKHSQYNEEAKGNVKAMVFIMTKAIEEGGTHLDCFMPVLPGYYAQFQFAPVARVEFDPIQKPDRWNDKRDKTPDIIFMAIDTTLPPLPPQKSTDSIEAHKVALQLHAKTAKERCEAQLKELNYTTYDEGATKQQEFLTK